MTDEDRVQPIGLFNYAHSYGASAAALHKIEVRATHPDTPVAYMYSHAVELYLKSFLRMKGVTVEELRSRKLGHDMIAIVEKAVSLGLELTDLQQGQIKLLNDSVLDRYIETGFRTILPIEHRHELCVYLHDTVGPAIYQDHKMTVGPRPF